MATYTIVQKNLDGQGVKPVRVHVLAAGPLMMPGHPEREYWSAVTDVPCPATRCTGTIRWAEAGYVPGYRICDGCGRHYQAGGTADVPTLARVGTRRSRVTRGR